MACLHEALKSQGFDEPQFVYDVMVLGPQKMNGLNWANWTVFLRKSSELLNQLQWVPEGS